MFLSNPEYGITPDGYEVCFKKTPERCVMCNCRTKVYPNFGTVTAVASTAVFKRAGFEEVKKIPKFIEAPDVSSPLEPYRLFSPLHCSEFDFNSACCFSLDVGKKKLKSFSWLMLFMLDDVPQVKTADNSGEVRSDSVKRALDGIFDIVLLNDWNYFITGTFDDKVLDASNIPLVIRKVQKWLNNCVCRKGLQYLLVPEYHPSSGRIHFHGLINNALEMEDSGRVCFKGQAYTRESVSEKGYDPDNYKTIFNISDWRFGFSTAIPADDNRLRLARYVTKYITKDLDKIFGRFYWHSRNINAKPELVYSDVEYGEVDSPEYFPPNTYVRYKFVSDFKD